MNPAVRKYIQRMTSKGGKARAKALTAERRSEIAKQAAQTRWNPKSVPKGKT